MFMDTSTLTTLLRFAGILHLGLLWAGLVTPGVIGLRTHLATLPSFIRRLFWVYYAFIGLCLVGFGCLTFTFAGILAAGGILAKAVCFFLAAFWALRLIVAVFVFDVRPYLTNAYRYLGYHLINLVFIYLPAVYFFAGCWAKP
jgi:hypothetical protein